MILHMVCAYSAYRQAAVLAEKTGQAVVLALLNFWLRFFGPMKSLRIDLGSEFDNKKVIELSEKYNFALDPTPGGAHWAGGVIEAQHGTLRRMLCATIAETGCPLEDCLIGCIIASNTMGQVHGFTP